MNCTQSASLICPCASHNPKVDESYPSRDFLPNLKQDLSGFFDNYAQNFASK